MERIYNVFNRFLENSSTAEEIGALLEYSQKEEHLEELDRLMSIELMESYPEEPLPVNLRTMVSRNHSLLKNKIAKGRERSVSVKRIWIGGAIAASILMCVLLKFFVDTANYFSLDAISMALVNREEVPNKEVMITFSDGSSIMLNDKHHGIQMVNDQIYYESGDGVLDAKKYQYLTVNVPRGEQFKVILSDGSTVYLNAESSLRYPVVFPKGERRVELHGEAYFTVAKHADRSSPSSLIPFIVEFDKHEVKVHGTQFNIRNYEDEGASKVSLVTGKISVHGKDDKLSKGVFLVPGQQANVTEKSVAVRQVMMEHEIAWKEGLFTFENKSFEEVMNELARWYNIDVEYQGPIPSVDFFGRAHRKEKLVSILNLLKSVDITYRLVTNEEGRQKQKLIIINNRKEEL